MSILQTLILIYALSSTLATIHAVKEAYVHYTEDDWAQITYKDVVMITLLVLAPIVNTYIAITAAIEALAKMLNWLDKPILKARKKR